MLFKAKKVFWNKWLLWLAIIVAIILYMMDHRYTSIGIIVTVTGILAYIFRNSYFFYISENELICKGGMFFRRFKLKNITGVRLSRHPFFIFSPFKAMFRVRIRYINENNKVAYFTISPQSRDLFIIELMKKCSYNQN